MTSSTEFSHQVDAPQTRLELILYVAGKSPNSQQARLNLDAIFRERLPEDRWTLEVVDLFESPLRALEDQILVTPTLVKRNPPVVRIVGNLSDRQTVLAALGLTGDEV